MKKQLINLSLLSVFSSSASWATGPVFNIAVTGDIKPPTCTVNGATQNNVIFDYGKISPSLIPQSKNYQYPASHVKEVITISCDADTYLTFQSTDTYDNGQLNPEEYNSGWFYLVNNENVTQTVGAGAFVWQDATVDNQSVYISRSNNTPINGSGTTYNNVLYKGMINGWTSKQQNGVSLDNLDLVSGKVFQATFRSGGSMRSFILSKDSLLTNGVDVSQGIDFIGEAVLTFNFGV